MSAPIDNPILNSPYAQPDRHYEMGPSGPTGEIKDGRRPSESFIPIAVSKKGGQLEPGLFMAGWAVGDPRKEKVPLDQVRQGLLRALFTAFEEALSECRLQPPARRSS